MTDATLLGPWIRRFLLEYLVGERNLARSTQQACDQLLDHHAARRNDVWNAALVRQPRRPPGRPQECRMQMDDIGAGDFAAQ